MLNIAHVIDAPFPAKKYGGTERALLNLASAQAQKGYKVRILCSQKTERALAQNDNIDLHLGWPQSSADWNSYQKTTGIDLVHFHGLPMEHIKDSSLPFISSVQGNGKVGESFHPNSVFVSSNHAQRHNSDVFVYNSIDLAAYPLRTEPLRASKKVAFLAKASWSVKNLKGASQILAGSPFSLEVMGGSRWKTPWALLNSQLRFHGMVDDRQKVQILHQCRCLLFPILWHEPFGIALIEALATGIPVAGHPFGSLPEIVSPEVGILSTNPRELLHFIQEVAPNIDPQACRAHVQEHFSPEKSADKFEAYYQKVLSGEALNYKTPRSLGSPLDISISEA